ncbi:hypothetical protein ALC60_11350 [Trachymyrmex zeteki]|uniref:Uncharacterized protein n=1 Tax=Mycetomoellerius zeteki TaxID=64791 RepID=A0A151WNX4_9HYME|nr:hypothetical protein ALC60_11350 [Trachymyrmex zeteki]
MHLMTYISPRVAIWGPFCPASIYVAHGKSCARACLHLLFLFHRARGAPLLDVSGFLRYRESFRVRLRATDYRNQAIPGSGISTANYNHRFFSYVTSLFSCRFVRTAPRMYDQTDDRGEPRAVAAEVLQAPAPGPTGLSACSSPRADGGPPGRRLRDDEDGALEAGDAGGGDGVGSEAAGSSVLESWGLSADGREWWWSEERWCCWCPGPPPPLPLPLPPPAAAAVAAAGPEPAAAAAAAAAPSWKWDSADSRCPRCRSRTRPTSSPLPPCPCCRCCCCCCCGS